MLGEERRKQITNLLYRDGNVSVTELSRLFDVAEVTIRRDLESLEAAGFLKRIHGGAIINESLPTIPLFVRESENQPGKRLVARAAARHIKDGDTLTMLMSTTVMQMTELLRPFCNLTVLTNSPELLITLARNNKDFTLISSGGTLLIEQMAFIGPQASELFDRYEIDKLFFSCRALSKERGVFEINEYNAELIQRCIRNSREVFLLMDDGKFDLRASTLIAPWSYIDYLVTNKELDDEWIEVLQQNQVEYIYAEDNIFTPLNGTETTDAES